MTDFSASGQRFTARTLPCLIVGACGDGGARWKYMGCQGFFLKILKSGGQNKTTLWKFGNLTLKWQEKLIN